jgi:hypothetical protein
MAHMLARLTYRMLKFGHDYVDRGIAVYEVKYQQTTTTAGYGRRSVHATCSSYASCQLSF